MLLPIVCVRCGIAKRDEDGRTLFMNVADNWHEWAWKQHCPPCYEALETMAKLEALVAPEWGEDGT